MATKVLLVEDQKHVRSAVAEFLNALGVLRVEATVGTEAEALDWLQHHQQDWDLAVVDLILEQGSGLNVIKRARQTSPEGHIVVLSGFATPGMRQYCEKLGANAVFDKVQIPAFVRYCRQVGPQGGDAPAAA